MNYSITFKPLAELTPEEKKVLFGLTCIQEGHTRSVFQQWLRHSNPKGMYTAMVNLGEETVAWAAASTHELWQEGKIGVFVKPEYRKKGLAHLALDSLLTETKKHEERFPKYWHYNRGLERVFRPILDQHGLKDLSRDYEEYNRQMGQ
ncbi:MAG: GNAT family N-acetyltransferase [Nanoarchaeota archaeon]